MKKTQVCQCPGCGLKFLKALPAWCECNPTARFKMMPLTVIETVDAVMGERDPVVPRRK